MPHVLCNSLQDFEVRDSDVKAIFNRFLMFFGCVSIKMVDFPIKLVDFPIPVRNWIIDEQAAYIRVHSYILFGFAKRSVYISLLYEPLSNPSTKQISMLTAHCRFLVIYNIWSSDE